MPFRLLDLPNELIAAVVEQIDEADIRTLCSVARTCSRLQHLAEPALYRHVLQRSGKQAIQLGKALKARPKRAAALQVIDSRCKWDSRVGLLSLAPVIRNAANLRELTVESPYCNFAYPHGDQNESWKRTMYQLLQPVSPPENVQNNSLPRLTTLTLHLSGETERYWKVDCEIRGILAHPTLQSLTMSCAAIDDESVHGHSRAVRTPLKKLILIECDLSLEALAAILALPQALEDLQLGENCYHTSMRAPNLLCTKDPDAFFSALRSQKDSLKSVAYTLRWSYSRKVDLSAACKGFAEFKELQHITLDGNCPYFSRALMTQRTAPPNLRSLTAKGDMFRLALNPRSNAIEDFQSQVEWTTIAASLIKSLQYVSIVSTRTFTNCSQNHRQAVEKLSKTFNSNGASMQLFKRRARGCIPPFLYGERGFEEALVYRSGEGFVQAFGASNDRGK